MKVHFYGTRGSTPTSGHGYTKFGGNTTCLRIESACLPPSHWLAVDAGSGIVPLGGHALADKVQVLDILWTHYHHDHTQGLPLCALTYVPAVRINCYGPVDLREIGPKQMLEAIMTQPFFPIDFHRVASRFTTKGISHPSSTVLVVHPKGGFKVMPIDDLERLELQSPTQVAIGSGKYPLAECLVIKMRYSTHPERTISYRFEERSTGKTFVFLTDHENTDGIPQDLLRHVQGADFLAMDCQYSREKYDKATAGFGHGTPDGCVRLASKANVMRLGLTHHDPPSTDEVINRIFMEASQASKLFDYQGEIFPCADYHVVVV